MPRFAERRNKLRKLLKKQEVEALLVTNFSNVTYLTGFTGDDSYLLVMRSGEVLLTDPRYTEQLANECPSLALEVRQPGKQMTAFLEQVLPKTKVARLGVEANSMSVALYEVLKDPEKFKRLAVQPTSGLVEELRQIKDAGEVAEIREAIGFAEKAFAVVRASLRPGLTEKQIGDDLEHQIRLFGGKCCSFTPIVGVGPRSALPHGRPSQKRVEESGFLLIDWGARGRLYVSDLTRVLVTGKIPPKLERVYGVVLKAQAAGIAAIRPGAKLHEVDAAARNVIVKAGFGEQFGHGLGHGIGLDIHEAPRVGVGQEGELEAGMVVTVEPGIYFPGWGGVRIEDDVLVTKGGHEVLSSVPKEFAECVVQ